MAGPTAQPVERQPSVLYKGRHVRCLAPHKPVQQCRSAILTSTWEEEAQSQEFKVSLSFIADSRSAWATGDTDAKQEKKYIGIISRISQNVQIILKRVYVFILALVPIREYDVPLRLPGANRRGKLPLSVSDSDLCLLFLSSDLSHGGFQQSLLLSYYKRALPLPLYFLAPLCQSIPRLTFRAYSSYKPIGPSSIALISQTNSRLLGEKRQHFDYIPFLVLFPAPRWVFFSFHGSQSAQVDCLNFKANILSFGKIHFRISLHFGDVIYTVCDIFF